MNDGRNDLSKRDFIYHLSLARKERENCVSTAVVWRGHEARGPSLGFSSVDAPLTQQAKPASASLSPGKAT